MMRHKGNINLFREIFSYSLCYEFKEFTGFSIIFRKLLRTIIFVIVSLVHEPMPYLAETINMTEAVIGISLGNHENRKVQHNALYLRFFKL